MTLYRAQERLIIAQLEVDLIKTVHKGRLGRRRTPQCIAGEVEMLLISAAVLVGHVRGRPRNSAEIARNVGIPRVTVRRKLETLTERGIVTMVDGNRYLMTERDPNDDYAYIDAARSLIRDSAHNLK